MEQSYRYLKDEAHYSEIDDGVTIEECRAMERRWSAGRLDARARHMLLYVITGERCAGKVKRIQVMMDNDRTKDERWAHAVPPADIRCKKCGALMECTFRDLDRRGNGDEVLFFFDCSHDGGRAAYWESGAEWECIILCPSFEQRMNIRHVREGDVITTTCTCSRCGRTMSDEIRLHSPPAVPDPAFDDDRKKYCPLPEEGREYISQREKIRDIVTRMEDRQENQELYARLARIKRLSFAELAQCLARRLETSGYGRLELGTPDMKHPDVVVSIVVQDRRLGRAEYNSIKDLHTLITTALSDTNWRLMSDGIGYRLGLLTGRLRGMEGEERLKEMVLRDLKKEDKPFKSSGVVID